MASSLTTTFPDTGLPAGTTNYYVVTAFNGGGESSNSPEASARTVPVYSLSPLADAYVRDGSYADSNFGGDTNLTVKYDSGSSGNTRISYLKFDVQALSNVLSAKLILTPSQVDGDGSYAVAYELWSNDSWAENTITWNNQPAGSGTAITNAGGYALAVPVMVDVTAAVKSEATNDGVLTIRMTRPVSSYLRLDFYSKDPTSSYSPVLQYSVLNNTPPSLAATGNRTIGVGVTLSITNSATDSDVPAQALTYSLLTAPVHAAINEDSGVISWRPEVTQADTTNSFTVRVADNGTPSLSATQSFTVTVSPLAKPQIATPSFSGGQLVLLINGDNGPDYQIQASTNLTDWAAVFATNSPAMPFAWTNSTANGPVNFFRVLVGPPFP